MCIFEQNCSTYPESEKHNIMQVSVAVSIQQEIQSLIEIFNCNG